METKTKDGRRRITPLLVSSMEVRCATFLFFVLTLKLILSVLKKSRKVYFPFSPLEHIPVHVLTPTAVRTLSFTCAFVQMYMYVDDASL